MMEISLRLYARQLEGVIRELQNMVIAIDDATDDDAPDRIAMIAERRVRRYINQADELRKIEEDIQVILSQPVEVEEPAF